MEHTYEFVIAHKFGTSCEVVGIVESLEDLKDYIGIISPDIYDILKKCCRIAMMHGNDIHTTSINGIDILCRKIY
jgi:hypothetical protein